MRKKELIQKTELTTEGENRMRAEEAYELDREYYESKKKEINKNENQQTICEWAERAFGAPNSIKASCKKIQEETDECIRAVDLEATPEEIGEECADIYIVLVQIAQAAGMDLQHCVNQKMAKNRAQKWKKTADGVFRHV